MTGFFTSTLKDWYKIFLPKLAILGFEVSGQYYLADLKSKTNTWAYSAYFIEQSTYDLIAVENRKYVKTIEEL